MSSRIAMPSRGAGFLLVPVTLALTLVAAIAYLVNRESGLDISLAVNDAEARQARYVAAAGLQHAIWYMQNSNCGTYSSFSNVAFGGQSYSVGISPSSGSPVSVITTGDLASGASHSLTRSGIRVYQEVTTVLQPAAAGADTYIRDGAGNDENYGSSESLIINNDKKAVSALLQFDLSGFPPGTTVLSATLGLYLDRADGIVNGVLDLHRLTQAWEEGQEDGSPPSAPGATWKDYDGSSPWASPGGDFDPTPEDSLNAPALALGWYEWDLSPLAQNWLSGLINNDGLIIRAGGGTVKNLEFVSGERVAAALHPKLSITWLAECP